MGIDLIIENGTVVTAVGTMRMDIAVNGEKILALGFKSGFPRAEKTIDATGKIVIPGGIDTHSHFESLFMGERVSETWEMGTIASAIGGTTTTMDFASQDIGKSLMDAVKSQLLLAGEASVIDYTTRPILRDFSDLSRLLGEMREVLEYGIMGFKGATIYRKEGWYENDWQLFSVLQRVGELGGVMAIHAENGLIGEERRDKLVKEGKIDPRYHGIAKPNFTENMDIQKCMMLAEITGTPTYIVHTSTGEGPKMIDLYRRRGLAVFCETCPHYLMLGDEMFEPKERGIYYICSPPLRKQKDREMLWRALLEGKIDAIGSDHVAYSKEQKEGYSSFAEIPNGLPGCEVRIPLLFSEGVLKRGLSLQRFADITARNGAMIFGLYPKKGVLAPGSDADIVIMDPKREHSLDAKDLHMGTDLSVFEGMEVTGWPETTILRGEIIVEDEAYIGKTGGGEFVRGSQDPGLTKPRYG